MYRNSDVDKGEESCGWELVLSHDIKSSVTTGFYKGTKHSNMAECLDIFWKCVLEISHPMLLPILICSQYINIDEDLKQRENRQTVRELEKTIANAAQIYMDSDITNRWKIDLRRINKDLVDCYYKVLWKRPDVYLDMIGTMQGALTHLHKQLQDTRSKQISEQHSLLEARLEFLRAKLRGIITNRQIIIARLEVLQGLVQNLASLSSWSIAHIKTKRIERDLTQQREEARQRESKSLRKKEKELKNEVENRQIALLGIIFLPGFFVAVSFV